ncbi:hypothetical protein [Dyella silvae]|uniref:hypothetical protein n=1 Tax=Dyella silvae TaxID=2994424 RepID=UPI0022647F4C|nr:hypothetical protein [Dyella silvae]
MIFGVFDIVCYDLTGYGFTKWTGAPAGSAMRGRTNRPEPIDMGAKRADESPSLSRFRAGGESAGADYAQGYGSAGLFLWGAHPVGDKPAKR